jgi:hypothetical protein
MTRLLVLILAVYSVYIPFASNVRQRISPEPGPTPCFIVINENHVARIDGIGQFDGIGWGTSGECRAAPNFLMQINQGQMCGVWVRGVVSCNSLGCAYGYSHSGEGVIEGELCAIAK